MSETLTGQESIVRMVKAYYKTLMRIAFTYVKNAADAEDIVQDVFLSVYTNMPDFESPEHEKAWLIRCTINRCKNHLCTAWLKHTEPMDENLSYLPQEENEVLSAVMQLPEKYRIVIHLHYYEKYTIDEIAKLTGCKPAAVNSRLARARERLKSQLKGGFDSE